MSARLDDKLLTIDCDPLSAEEVAKVFELVGDVDRDHEMALLLNLMVDISCYGHDLPKELDKALDKALAEHTMLCITEHLNDYGYCIVPGCPLFENYTKKILEQR